MRIFLLSCLLIIPGFAGTPFSPISDDAALTKLRAKLAGKDHEISREIRRAGNKTLEFEGFIACEGDIKLFPQILGDFNGYRHWVLPGINNRSEGSHYRVKLTDVFPKPDAPEILQLVFEFGLAVYKKTIPRNFKMKAYHTEKSFTVEAEALPVAGTPIGTATAYLKAFPADGAANRLWIYLGAQTMLKSWLLYEALPEGVLKSESSARLDILVSNYQAEESRRLVAVKKR